MKIRKYPIWIEVAEAIDDKVKKEGYGFLIEMENLKSMLEIKKYEIGMTLKQFNEIQFDTMTKIIGLKDALLYDHQILLENDRIKGYGVLTPDDQVTQGYKRCYKKFRRYLKKALDICLNVDHTKLSLEATSALDRNINKTVFIMQAANKRRIPNTVKKKLISEK